MVLSFDSISSRLAGQRLEEPPVDSGIPAAVAMILRQCPGDLEILFIERAAHESDPWSGNLAFPGGKVEQGEEPRQAAERETYEEIGLDLGTARYLGRLSDIAGANLPVRVSCFVYGVHGTEIVPVLSDEVGDLFWIGLDDLLAAERHITATVSFADKELEVPAIRLPQPGKPMLWGLTYRLMMDFLEIQT
ncbi:MAG: CoA pyrophosphatase [Pedobacter sp.]